MRCHHCHEDVDIEWKFCPHCGRTLVDEKLVYWFLSALRTKKIAFTILTFEIVFLGILSLLLVDFLQNIKEKDKRAQEIINGQREATVDWEVEDRIFPITYAGDNQKLVKLHVSSDGIARLKAEVTAEGITSTQIKLFDARPEGTIVQLGPEITEEGYKKLDRSKKVPVNLKVTLLGNRPDDAPKEIINEKRETTFYSPGDIVWNDNGKNNSPFIVRLADKDKIEIANLIRSASDHMEELGGDKNGMVGRFTDHENIKRQLQAIFLAVAKDYQIRYVMAPFSYESTDIQQVKSPTQVLETKSGLCIELALLYAAALEHVGLLPVVVVTDNHAWPGVQLEASKDEYIFIESTMLDSQPEAALQQGEKNWTEVIGQPGGYKLLKFNQLRADGLLPMKL